MKFIAFLMSLMVLGAAMAGDFQMSVSTNSVKIAPERNRNAPAWVSGSSVPQGQLLKYANQFYMAEVANTNSTTAPSADANMRKLYGNPRRDTLVVCNSGTTTMWLNVGAHAVTNRGIMLVSGAIVSFTGINEAVYAVSDGTPSPTATGVDVAWQY